MDLIYLLHALAKRKWIIIFSTLLALVAAFGYTFNQPKMYKSTAQLSTGFTINSIAGSSDQSLNEYNVEVKFDNVVQNLNSPQVVGLLSDSLLLHDLENRTHPFRSLNEKQRNSQAYRAVNLANATKILADKLDSLDVLNSYNPDELKMIQLLQLYHYDEVSLLKKLYVYRVQNTDYIQIEFQSENPDLSATVVNTLCTEFLRHYGYNNSLRTTAGLQTLKTIMDQKKDTLDAKVSKLHAAGGTIDETSAAYPELISESQHNIQDIAADSEKAYLKLRDLQGQLSSMSSPSGSNVSQTNAEIIRLKKTIDDLNAQYIEGGEKDAVLHDKIAGLRVQYQDDLNTAEIPSTNAGVLTRSQVLASISDYKDQLEVDRRRIGSEVGTLNNLNSSRQSTSSKSAEVQSLENEITVATADYTAAQGKYNVTMDQQSESSNFKQVLFGQPAVDAEPSKRYIIIGIATITMFLLCALVIVFLEYLDISLKTPFQFSKLIDLKLISIINDIDMKKGLLNIISQQAEDNEKRENVFRELLRKLRYQIENSGFKIILFTSTKSGAGKTTLVQALAYSLSLSKKKVLILDTNFCNNDLTKQLHAKPTLEGISLDDNMPLEQELEHVLTSTEVPYVDAIGCKGGDYTPLEILPKHHLLGHLQELTAKYDYIFLEGAPLNDYSDSRELLGYVDGVVAIFSAKYAVNQVDKESVEFLKSLNGKLVGAILNKVELEDIEK
jgi:succinoglycan biosynthesis transport protein ExoP